MSPSKLYISGNYRSFSISFRNQNSQMT